MPVFRTLAIVALLLPAASSDAYAWNWYEQLCGCHSISKNNFRGISCGFKKKACQRAGAACIAEFQGKCPGDIATYGGCSQGATCWKPKDTKARYVGS
jgi:hypothetical protein